MKLRSKQRGAWLGLVYTLGSLGFFGFIGLKIYPVYLTEMKIERAVKEVAGETEPNAESGSAAVTSALNKFWNVEDIEVIKASDVKLKNTDKGKVLKYDYWSQVQIFANVFLSFHFEKEYPIKGGNTY